MAYCSNCGTELNEGAKFCPQCGNAVGVGDNKFSRPNKRVNKRPKKEDKSLTIAQKIALGISALPAFIGLCGGVVSALEGVWSILLVSICASAAIILVAIGEIDKKYAWAVAIGSFMAIFVTIGSSAPDREENSSKITEKQHVEKPKQEVKKVFFEKGYKYSTSYRVRRNQGCGISCNYQYVLKMFNDGTKEISASCKTDDGSPATYGTHSCEIEKKNDSYRDVSATWYEITFTSGYSWGGRYHTSNNTIYVDEDGNIIMLGENGNTKNIYEAIATKDCIFGKFKKEKLEKETYRCKTCGKEYDPGKEALYSEEYCYMDYPQECKTCGKIYTLNTDGRYACLGTCSNCYEKHIAAKIVEDAHRETVRERHGRY